MVLQLDNYSPLPLLASYANQIPLTLLFPCLLDFVIIIYFLLITLLNSVLLALSTRAQCTRPSHFRSYVLAPIQRTVWSLFPHFCFSYPLTAVPGITVSPYLGKLYPPFALDIAPY